MKITNVFDTLNQIFWQRKIFSKKLEYCFLAEIAKTENPPFLQ